VKGTESLTCAREGIRTPNLLIRSQMLYPLSYARLFICDWQYYPLFLLAPNATQSAKYVAFLGRSSLYCD